MQGYTEAVKVLLEYGGDWEEVNAKGQTPMQLAQAKGHRDVVRLIEAFIEFQREEEERESAAAAAGGSAATDASASASAPAPTASVVPVAKSAPAPSDAGDSPFFLTKRKVIMDRQMLRKKYAQGGICDGTEVEWKKP